MNTASHGRGIPDAPAQPWRGAFRMRQPSRDAGHSRRRPRRGQVRRRPTVARRPRRACGGGTCRRPDPAAATPSARRRPADRPSRTRRRDHRRHRRPSCIRGCTARGAPRKAPARTQTNIYITAALIKRIVRFTWTCEDRRARVHVEAWLVDAEESNRNCRKANILEFQACQYAALQTSAIPCCSAL